MTPPRIFCKLNHFCSNYVSLIILSGIFFGFLDAGFPQISNNALSLMLFIQLFLACFKIKFEDVREIRVGKIACFFLLRYLILPVLMFYLGSLVSVELGLALLLLTLLPAGVSSPGFTSLFNGNVALTIVLVLVSSLSAPLYIPLIIKNMANLSIRIDAMNMFLKILLIVVAPILLHLPFRKSSRLHDFLTDNNPMLMMPLVWITIVGPISRIRAEFLSNLSFYLQATAGFMFFYMLFMLYGFVVARIQKNTCIKSYIIASLIHNITLGVVLSQMYFPSQVSSLVITANISWLLMITFLKPVFKRLACAD